MIAGATRESRLRCYGIAFLITGLSVLPAYADAPGADSQPPALAPAPAAGDAATAGQPVGDTDAESCLPAAYFGAIGDVQLEYGLNPQACRSYSEAIARSGAAAEKDGWRLKYAHALERCGRRREAQELWKALAGSGESAVAAEAEIQVARGLAAEGHPEEALARLEKLALESPHQFFRQMAAREMARLLEGRPEDRAKRLETWRRRMAEDPANRNLVGLTLAIEGADPRARLETLKLALQGAPHGMMQRREYAAALLEAGELDEAERQYQGLLRDYPSERQAASESLARIAVMRKDPARAEKLIEDGAEAIPEGERKSLYFARRYLSLGLWEAAERNARRALDLADGKAMRTAAAIELAEALVRKGNSGDEAAALLKPIAEQDEWRGLKHRAVRLLEELGAGRPKPRGE